MCGRFVQASALRPQRDFPLLRGFEIADNYNLAPTQRAATILDDAGAKVLRPLRWGMLAPWMKDLKGAFSTINARVETVATKPVYRAAFKAPRRCLVPMDGYYEWRLEGKAKQPYFVTRKDAAPLYAAGLWEPHHWLQDEDARGSFTIITRDAIDEAGEVHDRMPVFLPADLADAWMAAGEEAAMAMLQAVALPALEIRKVDRAINNARNRGGPQSLTPIP
jgi:putative SOS response-associated peptidase YedK